ncbi:hypothetical protein THAOC_25254 [Thalassiosira oceanica]|uniref:Nitroreductase domain-containing protein n=1 Tax=Thalassiosira oceanica TaxID=159749 RepID=K0S1Y4_THAOC|nr:hypothetical protein THAOC_25254 [Thalassiosira oceanica]|eukprot:EJK55051.1 hypothetical protein THAOC_25254 [Thalassiosira oceanica]
MPFAPCRRRPRHLNLSRLEGKENNEARDLLDDSLSSRSIFTKQYTGRSVNREIVKEMLDAARYAPNHHITEPWRFIIFESPESKQNVALLLAEMYKKKSRSQGSFKQAKYDKKIKSASKASHIVAICVKTDTKSMLMEEVCATAMAVQNMHLVATAYHVGAYWSSGGVSESTLPPGFQNAPEMAEFLSHSILPPCIASENDRIGPYTDQSQPKLSNWQQDRAFLCCLHLSIRRGKNDFINSSSNRIQYLTVAQARRTLKTDLNTDHGMVSFFLRSSQPFRSTIAPSS